MVDGTKPEILPRNSSNSHNGFPERDIAQEAVDYATDYNDGKLAMAKELTKDKLVETATRDSSYEGLPEWVQTEKERDLYLREIEKGNVPLLDQIGDAYINSIYGVNPDGTINPKSVYNGKIYQLPQGVKPKNEADSWHVVDKDYIKSLAGNKESLGGGYNVDNIHVKDDGEIHYDPNNPKTHPIKHLWDDKLRMKTEGGRSDKKSK